MNDDEATATNEPRPAVVAPVEPSVRPDALQAGDWIDLAFGSTSRLYYVLANNGGLVRIGREEWLVRDADPYTHAELLEKGYRWMGRGKLRWWWKLLPWRQCFCPMSKPAELWWA